jgi:hypothetical protein
VTRHFQLLIQELASRLGSTQFTDNLLHYQKGIKFGSIYSNSLGLIRRKVWQDYTFDESINGMEDYDWAIRKLKAGHCVARLKASVHYQRNAHNRDMRETARAFFLADRYGLAVRWLGVSAGLITE